MSVSSKLLPFQYRTSTLVTHDKISRTDRLTPATRSIDLNHFGRCERDIHVTAEKKVLNNITSAAIKHFS